MDKDVVPSFKMPSTDSNISNTYFMNIEQPPGENAFFFIKSWKFCGIFTIL